MKTFYLTKEFIQKELGILNIVVAHAPVSMMNNKPVMAKHFIWNSIDELKNDDMITDIKASEGSIFMWEFDQKQYSDLGNDEFDFVEDFNVAEKFIVRLLV